MSRSLRALKLAAAILLGLLLPLALVFALAQTPPGRAVIEAALARIFAGPGERATVTGIAGLVPFDMTIGRIEIDDSQGARIVVQDAALDLTPADLLKGRLTLRRLSAREVDVARPSATPSNFDLSRLLNPPLSVRLEQLRIDRLVIGPAIAGERVVASLSADGSIGGGSATADLDLRRVDAPGAAKFHLALAGTPPKLDVQGEVNEPSGRLLADALGRSEPLPLTLHLAGEGPLADWHGSLALSAGAEAAIDAEFRISGDATRHITGTGEARLGTLPPPQLRPLLAGSIGFSAALDLGKDEIALTQLSVGDAAAQFTAQGHFARASRAVAAEAKLVLPDLGALTPLTRVPSAGAASLSLTLGGTTSAPVARLGLAGEHLAFGANRVAKAAATIDISSAGDPRDGASPIALSASGDLEGLLAAAGTLPGGMGERLDWRLGATLDRARRRLSSLEIAVEDAGSSLGAHAAGDAGGIAGSALLRVPDLGRIAGAGTAGSLALAADFNAAADGSGTAVLTGTIAGGKSGAAALDRLLGGKATIAGTLRRAADGAIAASEVSVDGENAGITASGKRGTDGKLEASYRVLLPRLAALDPSLAGEASIAGTLAGPAGALTASATLDANAPGSGSLRLDRLEARLTADLASMSGRLEASFSRGDLRGTASAEGALTAEAMRLSRIRLDAAGTRIDGEMALRRQSGTLDGTLAAVVPALKPWSSLLGTALAGSATLKARLAGGRGQTLDMTLEGKALSIGGARVQRLQASARLADLLAQPTGKAELQIEQATLGTTTASRLSLGITGERPGRFALSASAQGLMGEPYALSAGGTARLDKSGAELALSRLAGDIGKQHVRLTRPLLLRRQGDDLAFADLDLSLGPGHVFGSGSLKGGALALRLQGAQLPVHSLGELGGYHEVSGVLGFDATLSGSRTRPEGKLIVDGEELRFAATSRPDLAPLGLVMSADWRSGVVTARGRLAGPNNAALGFSGSVPLVLAPQRLAPRLPPRGALSLHLEGGGELGNLADILPLGEDRLAGRFDIDVTVSGTVASPAASGRLSVRDGRYESLFWGTALTGISFDLVGNHERLVLQNFHAGDGAKGTLALSGGVDLAAASGPTFDVSGKFADFRAVQRDEATATVSGSVSLSGSLAAPRLGARLKIEQAELRVPRKLPQSVRPIPVTIINSATNQVLSTPEENQPRVSLLSLALDVEVELPGQVFVRGRGLDSEWRGHLAITGTTGAPKIDGKLEIVRGTYDFIGKTANINTGTITFVGGKKIDPEINIEARVSSTDVVAIIRITGTATQPAVKLSSQPQLPQDEILARVLFGTSVSSISPAQGLEIAQAAAALASGGDPGVLDKIRSGLGLDRLTFGSTSAANPMSNVTMPNTPTGVPSAFPTAGIGSSPVPASSGSTPGTTSVSAGKYVANGVYVGVSQGLGAGSSSVDVQIDVTRHISIDTTAGGQTAGTGVGINWKLDY